MLRRLAKHGMPAEDLSRAGACAHGLLSRCRAAKHSACQHGPLQHRSLCNRMPWSPGASLRAFRRKADMRLTFVVLFLSLFNRPLWFCSARDVRPMHLRAFRRKAAGTGSCCHELLPPWSTFSAAVVADPFCHTHADVARNLGADSRCSTQGICKHVATVLLSSIAACSHQWQNAQREPTTRTWNHECAGSCRPGPPRWQDSVGVPCPSHVAPTGHQRLDKAVGTDICGEGAAAATRQRSYGTTLAQKAGHARWRLSDARPIHSCVDPDSAEWRCRPGSFISNHALSTTCSPNIPGRGWFDIHCTTVAQVFDTTVGGSSSTGRRCLSNCHVGVCRHKIPGVSSHRSMGLCAERGEGLCPYISAGG